MGIKFKCMSSGNVFEFTTEHDIKTMRAHPEYQEVKDVEVVVSEDKPVKRQYNRHSSNKE